MHRIPPELVVADVSGLQRGTDLHGRLAVLQYCTVQGTNPLHLLLDAMTADNVKISVGVRRRCKARVRSH